MKPGKRAAAALAFAMLCLSGPVRGQVFDSHVHLHKGAESVLAYEAQLKASSLSVTGFGGMWFGGPNQAPQGQVAETRASNDALIALAKAYPTMMPIGTVHPYDGDAALAELQRIATAGVRVIKIHPHTQRFDAADPRVLALVSYAGELGMIVLMDNANILPGDSEKLFNLALAAPKTKFIFAHVGGMNFRFWNVLKLARTAEGLFGDNVYFDLSAIVTIVAGSPIAQEFVWTLRNVGIDHVLLGSDYPQFSLKQNLDALNRLPLSATEKAKIRSTNAAALFAPAPQPASASKP